MEGEKENEREREEGEANNSSVLFSALCKDVVNVLDFMERLKNEEDQKVVGVELIGKLKFELAFICTYIQLPYPSLEQFESTMNSSRLEYVQLPYFNLKKFENTMNSSRLEVQNLLKPILDDVENSVGSKYDMHYVLPSLVNNMDECIRSCYRAKSSSAVTEDQLDFLLLNLHHLSKYFAEQIFPLVTQFEILQNVCGNIRNFHGLIVNGCVEQEIVAYVLPQFQLMAERVGCFLWYDQIYEDSRQFRLAHLFLKIIPIELEVMHIYFTNLEDSTSAEVQRFIKQLLETSPDILREYLIHLQEHMVTVITASTSGARNIHVIIEFLLIVLTDMPKDFIHHDKLFDLMARVESLTRKVSAVICDLEGKSRNKEGTDETNRASLDFLENIEVFKEDLKHLYLKNPDSSQCCFPMSDGLLFMLCYIDT